MFSLDDYWTLRKAAVVVRRSDRAVIAVTGRERATWLQGLLTNDVLALHAGQSCYSAYLTPQGRMITDMQVLARADAIWLDVPSPLAAPLRDRLDGLIFAEDAQVTDQRTATEVWGVYGAEWVQKIQGVQGVEGFEDEVHGFRFYLSAGETLPSEFAQLPQASLETLDVVRIEAGVPKFLVDMTDDTIPLEAGIEDRAISFTKGCYVGQEVIVRVTHRGGGRVAKRLVRWKDSSHQVAAGAKILAGEREIGRVTSAAFSPSENALIGLAYLHRDHTASNTGIAIVNGDERIEARVI